MNNLEVAVVKENLQTIKDPCQLPQLVFFQLDPSSNGHKPKRALEIIEKTLKEKTGNERTLIIKVSDGYCALPFLGNNARNARTVLRAHPLVARASVQGYKIFAYINHFATPQNAATIQRMIQIHVNTEPKGTDNDH